jgi:hypothetical protein
VSNKESQGGAPESLQKPLILTPSSTVVASINSRCLLPLNAADPLRPCFVSQVSFCLGYGHDGNTSISTVVANLVLLEW